MSSYKNHRVLVTSLFLPQTAALDRSSPGNTPAPTVGVPTPGARTPAPRLSLDLDNRRKSLLDSLRATPLGSPGAEKANPFALAQPSTPGAVNPGGAASGGPKGILRPKIPGPLKSIVEDMQVKSKQVTPLPSPGVEKANPFARAQVRFSPNHEREGIGAHGGSAPSRLQRKGSRSKSASGVDTQRQPWHVEANPSCNGGLANAIDSVRERVRRRLWVGTLGTTTDEFGEAVRRDIDARMLDEWDSVPVWIPDAEFSKCYDEFCHQVLWPALHYAIPDAPKTKSFYESESWAQYVAVNQRFADAIMEVYEEGDIIWVNDYHLFLLPQMLRSKLPTSIIGFFLHVAFPSSEIFRCLSVREPILRGLLAADLIGFQTTNHARHFRQTVSRILALEATPKGIQAEDRFVDVGVFPMGIDVLRLRDKKAEPEVKEWIETLKQRYAGFQLIVGRDKLDEVQGVKHKLLAFEMFLDKYPEFQQKVILIQVALQTSEGNEMQGGVADVVSRINNRFSTLTYQPVVFLHTHDLTFSQYLALLTVADAFLVTSSREGMALRTHEYVECQDERHRPLILSEFAGSYTYRGFRSCIAINPWDKRATASAIHQALTMPEAEAKSRWEDLHSHVVAQSAQAFVTSFLQRCVRTNIEHLHGDVLQIAALDVSRLLPGYRHSDRRLLLIDFEGTLWTDRDPRATTFNPPKEALDLVARLAKDMRNEVWLLSGLPVKGMMEKVAETVPGIGIVAENGCYIKKRDSSKWISMVSNLNLSWKGPCLEILHYFTERTPSSFVEEREASVVWRYWTGPNSTADRAWARRQAAEAQNHIFDSIGERFGLRIMPGTNSFLVLPNNVSRANAVSALLHPSGPVRSPMMGTGVWATPSVGMGEGTDGENVFDFVLAISADERLLRRLNDLEAAETCSTGTRGSDAKWRLDVKEVMGTLSQFAGAA